MTQHGCGRSRNNSDVCGFRRRRRFLQSVDLDRSDAVAPRVIFSFSSSTLFNEPSRMPDPQDERAPRDPCDEDVALGRGAQRQTLKSHTAFAMLDDVI